MVTESLAITDSPVLAGTLALAEYLEVLASVNSNHNKTIGGETT